MSRVLFTHPVLTVHGSPSPHSEHPLLRLHMPDWVLTVPITETGEVIFVRQHRHGVGGTSLEIPGGVVDPPEDELRAARRELKEETGYGGGMWESLGWAHPNPVLQDNKLWMFAVHGVVPVSAPSPSAGESITVERHALQEVPELILSGQIHHALSLLALQRVLLVEGSLQQGPPGV